MSGVLHHLLSSTGSGVRAQDNQNGCYGDSQCDHIHCSYQDAQFDEWTRQTRSLIDFVTGNCRTASPESMGESSGEQGLYFFIKFSTAYSYDKFSRRFPNLVGDNIAS